jgi:hypothetical protein
VSRIPLTTIQRIPPRARLFVRARDRGFGRGRATGSAIAPAD